MVTYPAKIVSKSIHDAIAIHLLVIIPINCHTSAGYLTYAVHYISPLLHQMVHLYNDPHGKKVFSSVSVATDHCPNVSSGDEVDKLRKRVRELELTLKQTKVSLPTEDI